MSWKWVSNIIEFNIIILLIEIRIVVYYFICLTDNLFKIRFKIFNGSSTNYGDPNRARTISNNVAISLTLVAFGSGVDFGEIPFEYFASIVSFTAFLLKYILREVGWALDLWDYEDEKGLYTYDFES